ncbi:MAG: hypothetical protein IPG81_17160 [Sandaracinaceae bacterium]|nr:hypothetical protein [Sandaracinaceae bacterium]
MPLGSNSATATAPASALLETITRRGCCGFGRRGDWKTAMPSESSHTSGMANGGAAGRRTAAPCSPAVGLRPSTITLVMRSRNDPREVFAPSVRSLTATRSTRRSVSPSGRQGSRYSLNEWMTMGRPARSRPKYSMMCPGKCSSTMPERAASSMTCCLSRGLVTPATSTANEPASACCELCRGSGSPNVSKMSSR